MFQNNVYNLMGCSGLHLLDLMLKETGLSPL